MHLDFLRHTPILPLGKQWENREHLTSFNRDVRAKLQAQATKRSRPFLLATRVPDSVEGCHTDGIDIGSLATINGKPRYHAIDRRGGNSAFEGYASANSNASLPILLHNDQTPSVLVLPVSA